LTLLVCGARESGDPMRTGMSSLAGEGEEKDGLLRYRELKVDYTTPDLKDSKWWKHVGCCNRCWNAWKQMNPYFRCFLAVVLYFGVSIMCYKLTEKWSVLDICYFISITLSTVGYGDLAPKTYGGKICTILIIFLGLLLVGALVADLFETIFDSHQAVFLQELREMEIESSTEESGPSRKFVYLVREKGKQEIRLGVCIIASLVLAIYVLGVTWSMVIGGLDFLDALYFVTVTISTVGYGDKNASNMNDDRDSKIFAIFFVFISVFSFGAIITTAINLQAGVIRRKKLMNLVDDKISAEDFNRFLEMGDVNNDKRIDMAEFAFICLDELGLLDPNADMATLLAIQNEFRKADRSKSGYIDRSDIVEDAPPEKSQRVVLKHNLRSAMKKARSMRSRIGLYDAKSPDKLRR